MRRISGRAVAMRKQRGISLVVALVLLIATSILAVAVLRSSSLQERMSANLRDRSLAFQAAESALRFAQDEVLAAGAWDADRPTAATCANAGICPTGSAPAWRQLPAAAYDSARLSAPPEYWIEYLGTGPSRKGGCDTVGPVDPPPDCGSPIYRVTARSRAAGRAEVVLQANIISRIPDPGA
ncbi:MAG TPA: PilX N-terminal domain-containing pilus assembly protein [Lysobacter sp.]